jgi:hypothetical protein
MFHNSGAAMRVELIGDGITRSGDPVWRWTDGQGDRVIYTDYSECGTWAGERLWQQGWRFEKEKWSADLLAIADEVRAFGTGIWDAGEVWIGGNYTWEKEYDGRAVVRR